MIKSFQDLADILIDEDDLLPDESYADDFEDDSPTRNAAPREEHGEQSPIGMRSGFRDEDEVRLEDKTSTNDVSTIELPQTAHSMSSDGRDHLHPEIQQPHENSPSRLGVINDIQRADTGPQARFKEIQRAKTSSTQSTQFRSASHRTGYSKVSTANCDSIPGLLARGEDRGKQHFIRLQSNSKNEISKDGMVTLLATLLETATKRTKDREAFANKHASQSVPVSGLQTALTYNQAVRIAASKDNLTVPEYDPDYHHAMNLLEERYLDEKLHQASPPLNVGHTHDSISGRSQISPHLAGDPFEHPLSPQSSRSYRNSEDSAELRPETVAAVPCRTPIGAAAHSPSAARSGRLDSKLGVHVNWKTSTLYSVNDPGNKSHYTARFDTGTVKPQAHAGDSYNSQPQSRVTTARERDQFIDKNNIETCMDDHRDHRDKELFIQFDEAQETASLLRLGIDRGQLSAKAGDIYSAFLTDLIGLCRDRALASQTLEEAAMHRALAEHVSKSFASKDVARVRASMVASAVRATLS